MTFRRSGSSGVMGLRVLFLVKPQNERDPFLVHRGNGSVGESERFRNGPGPSKASIASRSMSGISVH